MKKRILLILLCSLFVVGCAATQTWEPVCKHRAIYAAIIVGEYHPVRIGIGPSTRTDGIYHAQAEVLINGKWQPLRLFFSEVVTGEQDSFIPQRYVTIEQAMKWIKLKEK